MEGGESECVCMCCMRAQGYEAMSQYELALADLHQVLGLDPKEKVVC